MQENRERLNNPLRTIEMDFKYEHLSSISRGTVTWHSVSASELIVIAIYTVGNALYDFL